MYKRHKADMPEFGPSYSTGWGGWDRMTAKERHQMIDAEMEWRQFLEWRQTSLRYQPKPANFSIQPPLLPPRPSILPTNFSIPPPASLRAPPLPHPTSAITAVWEELKTPDSRAYIFNKVTGQSMWKPENAEVGGVGCSSKLRVLGCSSKLIRTMPSGSEWSILTCCLRTAVKRKFPEQWKQKPR